MPIRVEELRAIRPGLLIAEDRPCRGCKYNLRGLLDNGVCPECRRQIRKHDLLRFADQMVDAPSRWVSGFRAGTTMLCIGGWLMALGLLAWGIFGHISWLAGAVVGSIAWSIGTVLATRPRPKTKRMEIDPVKEWAAWRIWARCSQPGWCIALIGLVMIQWKGWYTPAAIVPAAIFLLIGVVGWWPLMVMQSNLAYWASDSDLADKLRNCSWASALGMGIGAAMVGTIGGLNGGLTGSYATLGLFASAMVLAIWVLLGIFSLWYTLMAVWQLARLGVWVTMAQTNVAMRDERMAERVRKARGKTEVT